MVKREVTLVDRLNDIINIVHFFDFFDEIFIVDQSKKIISLESKGILNNYDLEEVFFKSKEEYEKYGFSFFFGNLYGRNFISFYFSTKSYEIVLVGVSSLQELGVKEISAFRLVALSIKDIFDMVEITASTIDRIGDLETLLNFYKSITTPINKELFLAYILDNIISEIGVEVGSIVLLNNEMNPVFTFSLGLDDRVTQIIFNYIKSRKIDDVVAIDHEVISGIIELEDRSVKNLISYPIKFGNEIVGVVFLANKRVGINYFPFSNNDIHKLSILLDPAGIVIKNHLMFKELFFLNQFNKKIIENIASIIVMTDNVYSIKYVNKREFYSLVEKIISSFSSKNLDDFLGRSIELQIDNNFYNVKAQSILDESGKVIEILWTIEDITYQKDLINKYVMSEKMNMISELISGIAHEIRNPISSVSGFIELLRIKKNDEKFIDKFIEVVSKDIGRIVNLLNSFMRFSKPVDYELSDVNLSSVISEVLDIFMYQLEQKNIKVKNSIVNNLVVRGNYSLLLQVFSNIIINSIQSINSPKGKIEIGSENYSENGKNYVIVSIKDNGIGIPKSIQSRIFDPFFTTKPDGTGLGLSICQKIVVDHGGFIKIESEEGKGTVVKVFLPCSKSK